MGVLGVMVRDLLEEGASEVRRGWDAVSTLKTVRGRYISGVSLR